MSDSKQWTYCIVEWCLCLVQLHHFYDNNDSKQQKRQHATLQLTCICRVGSTK